MEVIAKAHSLGCRLSPVDVRDYKIKATGSAVFPDEFQLSNLPAVKNQRSVSSCVAHALSSVVEYHNIRQLNDSSKMSTGYIYGNRPSGDKSEGMYPREALKCLKSNGDCKLEDFPENVEVPKAITLFEEREEELKTKAYPYRISTYFKASGANEIKTALMNYGPVAISIPVYASSVIRDGVVTPTSTVISGYHMIFIYGWNEKGWLIQNSWGTLWANKGRAILPFDYKINEAWGITDTIIEQGEADEDDIVKPWPTVILNAIAKVINFIINLFKK